MKKLREDADIEIVGANGDEAQANPDQPQIVPDAQ